MDLPVASSGQRISMDTTSGTNQYQQSEASSTSGGSSSTTTEVCELMSNEIGEPTPEENPTREVPEDNYEAKQAVDVYQEFISIRRGEYEQLNRLEKEEQISREYLYRADLATLNFLKHKYPELNCTFPDVVKMYMVLDNLYYLLTGHRFRIYSSPERAKKQAWVQAVCSTDVELSPRSATWETVRSYLDDADDIFAPTRAHDPQTATGQNIFSLRGGCQSLSSCSISTDSSMELDEDVGKTAIFFDNFTSMQQDERGRQKELLRKEQVARDRLSHVSTRMFIFLRNKYRELNLTFPDIVRTHMVLGNLYFLITGHNIKVAFIPEKDWVHQVRCLEDMEHSPDVAGWDAIRMSIDKAPRAKKKPTKSNTKKFSLRSPKSPYALPDVANSADMSLSLTTSTNTEGRNMKDPGTKKGAGISGSNNASSVNSPKVIGLFKDSSTPKPSTPTALRASINKDPYKSPAPSLMESCCSII